MAGTKNTEDTGD